MTISELVAQRRTMARQVAELNRKLEQIDAELFSRLDKALEAFGVAAERSVNPFPRNAGSTSLFESIEHAAKRPAKPGAGRGQIGDLVVRSVSDVLRAAGKPMRLKDIYAELERRGVRIPGKNPMNNVSAHASRSGVFKATNEGWWFAEKQEPPEGGP
jgi:hypothetical protein